MATLEKPIALPAPMTARIRSGANAGAEVFVTQYHPNSGKWEYDWPHSSAVGFLKPDELIPLQATGLSKEPSFL